MDHVSTTAWTSRPEMVADCWLLSSKPNTQETFRSMAFFAEITRKYALSCWQF